MPSVALDRAEFERRFRARFDDPLFEGVDEELGAVLETAWRSYSEHRKAPRTRKAGPEFADPEYALSLDWLAASDAIRLAESENRDSTLPAKVLVINASPRSEHSCPGETSKTWRL